MPGVFHGTTADVCEARGQKRKLGLEESDSTQVKLLVDQLRAVNQAPEGKSTLSSPPCGLGEKANSRQ